MTAGEANGDELIGKLLGGRYRVTATIGRGGMGVVARAVDELLNREVAVKVLRAFTDASAAELADLRIRMQREAQAAARIRHGGVVTVHDVTEEQGLPVIVMELVDGPSLDDVLEQRGALEPHEAAAIGAELMDALDAAHRAGVLHRDVKPANVLLEHGERGEMGVPPAGGWGRVVLTDFGIASMEAAGDDAMAKLTQSGQIIGSLDYLPPERAQGKEPGPASDIWSLGMTLYAAVEGTSPFRRTSVWSTLSAIVTEPLPAPRRAGPLAPVLQALMAKEPEDRPAAGEARELLQRVAAGGTAAPYAPTPGLGPAATPMPAPAPMPLHEPTPTQAVAPGPPPPGFGAAPPAFPQQPSPSPQQPSPSPQQGMPYPHPYAPPQPGAPAAHPAPATAPGRSTTTRSATTGRKRRRGRTVIAAAAAAVVLAGGGVTYALTGNHSSSTKGDEAQAAQPAVSSPAGGDQPGGGDATAGAPSPGPSSPTSSGKPSGAASASASAPAGPGATPSASASPSTKLNVPTTCSGWSHQDPKPGTYGYVTGDRHVLNGPYQVCGSVAAAKSGTKVWFHCSVENAYGHKWLYVRIDGSKSAGWLSADTIIRQSGQPTRC
ncbi:serine/threonine protein kinase [Streptosporangium nondiastaticum]|uniref:non-specific serine/threonine protein kinase n=1 Tax=Streptosporangium nondiastaticum TaxID=35764 RepID=A0A9X7JLE6_9ACTN|nr:serine/threonine-protein kinase [Streptosporangium nondiastaticum]PSJ25812.1 serine/threonine protein kinase [Streptosporangium nondiastaticum]